MRSGSAVLAVLAALLLPDEGSAEKRRAFVTSITGSGDISTWPGASGANALIQANSVCRARAAAGMLPHADTYRAWLSTSTTDAYCHVQGLTGKRSTNCDGGSGEGGGPWYLRDGISAFTGTLDELTNDGAIYRPVLGDEFGSFLGEFDFYYTGTRPDGTATAQTCGDWDATAATGTAGAPRSTSHWWTQTSVVNCTESHRLLCLEPNESEAYAFPWGAPASLVFLTTAQGSGEMSSWPEADLFNGYAGAQRICRNLADSAGLPSPQTFEALISDGDIWASDRVLGNGPYKRIDGFTVASSKADLLDGALAEAVHQHEDGTYLFSPLIQFHPTWTGSDASGASSGADCLDWVFGGGGEEGTYGSPQQAGVSNWLDTFDAPCDFEGHLYCFTNTVYLFWDGFELTHDTRRWSAALP